MILSSQHCKKCAALFPELTGQVTLYLTKSAITRHPVLYTA
nr:MAG TPA: hypothetical protein [Caudoviricetes sp.]